MTSVGGKVAMAGYGAYAGSKFALEAVSDALRRDVADFGVKVVVIEPGAVTTEMTGRLVIAAERITSGMTAEQRGRYDALMQAVIAQAQTFTREGEGLPAEEAGRVIADAIISKRPRTRYTVGRDAAIIVRLRSVRLRPHAGQPARPHPQTPPPQSPADAVSEQRALPSQPARTASVSMSCAKSPSERGRSPMSFAVVWPTSRRARHRAQGSLAHVACSAVCFGLER